jgi:hypothetical protein
LKAPSSPTHKNLFAVLSLINVTLSIALGYLSYWVGWVYKNAEYMLTQETGKIAQERLELQILLAVLVVFLVLEFVFTILWLKDRPRTRLVVFGLTVIHLIALTLLVAQYFYENQYYSPYFFTYVTAAGLVWVLVVDGFLFRAMHLERRSGPGRPASSS